MCYSTQSLGLMLHKFALLCAVSILLLYRTDAFTSVSVKLERTLWNGSKNVHGGNSCLSPHSKCSLLIRKLKEDDEDDEDDDEYIDDSSLGDWRKFRMNLSESGLSSASSSSSMVTEGFIEEDTSKSDKDASIAPVESTKNTKRPKSVSKQNEKLLMKQNKALAEEYLSDVWAHEAPKPEVGGLVVRLPLEAEIFRSQESSHLGKELQRILNLDNSDDSEEYESSVSLLSTPEKEETTDESSSPSITESDFSFSPLAAKTIFWYRKAKKLLEKEMADIASYAEDGEVDASKLPSSCQEFLDLYLDNQQFWQEVCLVIESDEKAGGSATTLVLNRPMAFSLSENLAKLILHGAFGQLTENRTELLVKMLTAFDNAPCGIYVGGPDDMDEPATVIHGIAGLEGSREISPGCGIYEGGLKAAVDGILAGEYSPLDFRFFVGKHSYDKGSLDVDVHLGKYQPVACARSVALKQCIQLPKPLWHEVMELCGGELSEISKLEMMKRDDLTFEEVEED